MKNLIYLFSVLLFFSCASKNPVGIILESEDGKASAQALSANAEVLKRRPDIVGFKPCENRKINILLRFSRCKFTS